MSEEFQLVDSSSLHSYRTEIPNIVSLLDLDPYAFRLYCHYKQIAGDSGACFQKKSTLTKQLKMSLSIIKDRNKVLSQKFALLNGKPLIKITQRKDEDGNNLPTLIQIVDIWPENFKEISTRFSGTPPSVAKKPTLGRQKTPEEDLIEEDLNNNNKETEPPVVVVPSCLDDLDINPSKKKQIAEKLSELDCKRLVCRVKAWKGKKSDLHGVNTILSNWRDWSDVLSKEDINLQNEEFLDSSGFKDGSEVHNHKVTIGKREKGKYIEFVSGRFLKEFLTTDKDFIEKLKEFSKERLKITLTKG